MQPSNTRVIEAAAYIKEKISHLPRVGFLTGTGLGSSTGNIAVETALPYSQIPHFPISTVESHTGQLLLGTLAGTPIMAMQGRFHLYEGYSPAQVTFPVRVMQALGIKYLIISNASGGLNLDFSPGRIMLITDHINLTGQNPLQGPNNDDWGIRFPDMTRVYDTFLADLARKAAESKNIPLARGVYAGLMGPSLETPAETRYLKTIGADAVGFSTVMEAIAGVHAEMKILGLATITNINNPDAPEKATVEEIIKTAEKAAKNVNTLITEVVSAL
ncbi:purine-nucleoside phosphorylase [Desulfocicer vacuolatum DSM 3385]|uniref:Purine nucleoside phosphorylase n=1 Tax=Desulfocicer vacuolatum DSM 3385 TaxID=1121400 RepID=A0A1W2CKN9_9BACT|nr:purine-nucleoside phosphorylase [Desulfocicer vacuolatum]SMC85544.1 purine-nucleoside phosphorylase [Desulfocicer vacuolatum DSM 3385]